MNEFKLCISNLCVSISASSCSLEPLGLISLSYLVCALWIVNPFEVSENHMDFYLHISSVNIFSKKKSTLSWSSIIKKLFFLFYSVLQKNFFPSDADQQRREKLKKELARCGRGLKFTKTTVHPKSHSRSLLNALQKVRQHFYLFTVNVSKVLHWWCNLFLIVFAIGQSW